MKVIESDWKDKTDFIGRLQFEKATQQPNPLLVSDRAEIVMAACRTIGDKTVPSASLEADEVTGIQWHQGDAIDMVSYLQARRRACCFVCVSSPRVLLCVCVFTARAAVCVCFPRACCRVCVSIPRLSSLQRVMRSSQWAAGVEPRGRTVSGVRRARRGETTTRGIAHDIGAGGVWRLRAPRRRARRTWPDTAGGATALPLPRAPRRLARSLARSLAARRRRTRFSAL